jgi:predicted GH43/DUF377 family glycosyl hydrolase
MYSKKLLTLLLIASGCMLTNYAQSKTKLHCGKFKKIYDQSINEIGKWYINDHCFIKDNKNQWHLFGITHKEPAKPLDELHFAHATAKNFTQKKWDKQKFALSTHKKAPWFETHLWAPHIIENNGIYFMYYCAGGKNHYEYKIHLATSKDMKSWTRHQNNPMIIDGYDARDPYILKLKDKWIMYYTANRPAKKGNHVVMSVESKDLINWGNKKIVFTHPRVGTYGGPTESPCVIQKDGKFYLFVCTNNPYDDTAVYESDSPFNWNIQNKVGKFPAHCAEVIKVKDKWYISRAGWGRGGVYIAELHWN